MYRNKLTPKKQAITQNWERPSTPRGPSIDVQVVS